MACRVIHCFGASVCEALPVQLVNDIFYLHERGKRLGIYTVCLCAGATGPLFAGYMLDGGLSWRLFFYVEFAFAGALFILAFFVVEETSYHRKVPEEVTRSSISLNDKEWSSNLVVTSSEDLPPRKTFIQTLKFWGIWEKDSQFFMMIARSFTYFFVPHVFWVITTYGPSVPYLFLSLPHIIPI